MTRCLSMAAALLLAAMAGQSAVAGAPAPTEAETLARLCGRAYQREDQAFLFGNCPAEAWALARAQCERGDESVAERYADYCRAFKSGLAPRY